MKAKLFASIFISGILNMCHSVMADVQTWNLDANGNWDTTSENWAGDSSTWVNGNEAVFSNATGRVVTITEAVSASSVTINNNGNWNFGGLSNLTAATFTKNGTGQMNHSGGADSFSGNIIVDGGSLSLASNTNLSGAGSIALNTGSTLRFFNGGQTSKEVVLNGGSVAFFNGNASVFTGTFSGSGDLKINTSESYGNWLTIQRANLSNTYTGDTYIDRNSIHFTGYNTTDFNPFGTNTDATVHLISRSGSYDPVTHIRFNPAGTNSTYEIHQQLNISASDGRPLIIQNDDGHLRFKGDISLNTDATSSIKFLTQYGGKDIWLDGAVSGSGQVVISDINSFYGAGAVHLTNNANTFSGIYTVDNSNGHYGTLSLDANNAAANAKVVLSNGHLRIAAADASVAGLSGASETSTVFNADATARNFTVNIDGEEASIFAGSLGNNTANGDNFSFTKGGDGTLILSGTSTYTGVTTVSAGTLLVNGSLGSTSVIVSNDARFGGTGTVNGNIHFEADSTFHVIGLEEDAFTIIGGDVTFGEGFGIANLFGIDWDTLELHTAYTLISTGQTFTADHISNFGEAAAHDVGNGRYAYFTNGSLSLVVIPEPSTALLGGFGLLALLRRRRA